MNSTTTNVNNIVNRISEHMKSLEGANASLVGNTRDKVVLENRMLAAYLDDPDISYAVCRRIVQPLLPEYFLTDDSVRSRAESAHLDSITVRRELCEWGRSFAKTVRSALLGGKDDLLRARRTLDGCYSESAPIPRPHFMQNQTGLACVFKYIPELRCVRGLEIIPFLGRAYAKRCLQSVFRIIEEAYEGERVASGEEIPLDTVSAEELIGEELSAFYSGLNSPEYGYLIDSLCINIKACEGLEARLPFEAAGIPIFLQNLMRFLIDSGVAPLTEYPPQSIQRLTLAQLMSAEFLPLHTRTTSIKPGQEIPVKVLSSGWRIKNHVISQPVLQEEEQK